MGSEYVTEAGDDSGFETQMPEHDGRSTSRVGVAEVSSLSWVSEVSSAEKSNGRDHQIALYDHGTEGSRRSEQNSSYSTLTNQTFPLQDKGSRGPCRRRDSDSSAVESGSVSAYKTGTHDLTDDRTDDSEGSMTPLHLVER